MGLARDGMQVALRQLVADGCDDAERHRVTVMGTPPASV